ncbi:Eukaryotic aspartyl protease family protein, putative [Theobroma cacao]|uniref:Eukaryotic aspartyl protease family protein, putative n=1 Tax=Theobroma cacao TaxID=3641 RepID=A0A061EZ29_THECC|nr:Eukaryotic aspartyl protease family protein, putative [Theobroma cacao]
MAATANTTSMFFIGFAILVLSCFCLIEAQKGGFSVELIHRDSPKSPLYNPLETASNRVANALRRSFNRAQRFKPSSISTKAVDADLIADSGEYLMNVSIGTPAFDIVAIADTGSDLIWTQCKPCSQCFRQDAPLFDPSKSSTFRTFSCSASQCENLEGSSCSSNNTCRYSVTYGDNSFSNGDVAADTLTLPSTTGRPVAFRNTIIGCGHNNDGTFDENTSGIIGLGGGDVSLISQLGTSIAGKFSYCLLPLSDAGESNKMNFGTDAIVSGAGVVSTPLTKKFPSTFYFLTLEAVSVGSKRIKFTGSSLGTDDGNIIIDSGTTLTLLPEDFYSELESAVASQIKARRVDGPQGLSLCYDATTDFAVPNITIHFTNADVKLAPLNTFVLVSDTVSCFTFSSLQGFAIYGNLAQMNFLVGYDTEKQTVSFKPTDCSKN